MTTKLYVHDWTKRVFTVTKIPKSEKTNKLGEDGYDNSKQKWSKESIFEGFKKFYDENGKYPTATEIDADNFLPSSRQIQKAFGGLKNLRSVLGLPVNDYGAGESRSKIAHHINKRALIGERDIGILLINYFGEYFVHTEKPLFEYFPKEAFFKDKIR